MVSDLSTVLSFNVNHKIIKLLYLVSLTIKVQRFFQELI